MIAGPGGLAGPGADIAPAGLAAAGAGLTVLRKQGWLLSVHANSTVGYKGLLRKDNACTKGGSVHPSPSTPTATIHTSVAASASLLPKGIFIRDAHAKLGQLQWSGGTRARLSTCMPKSMPEHATDQGKKVGR